MGDATIRMIDTKGNIVLKKLIEVKNGINMYILDEEEVDVACTASLLAATRIASLLAAVPGTPDSYLSSNSSFCRSGARYARYPPSRQPIFHWHHLGS